MNSQMPKSIAVIVAHPDDETLWAGGTILNHPYHKWFILCLTSANDLELAPRFQNTLKILKAKGVMGNLDNDISQQQLKANDIEAEIMRLLPIRHFDLIITHSANVEQDPQRRQDEINKAVIELWHKESISASELWTFAYEDGDKAYYPQAAENANIMEPLSEKVWNKKYNIITNTYGFKKDSWEAETTPTAEAFWQFKNPHHAILSATHFDNDIVMSKLSIFKLLSNTKY